jgi:hypothetical protein
MVAAIRENRPGRRVSGDQDSPEDRIRARNKARKALRQESLDEGKKTQKRADKVREAQEENAGADGDDESVG